MGFCNSSCSFTRFQVTEQIPNDFWLTLPDLLKKHSIKDIDDTTEMRAYGWVNFDDFLDTNWEFSSPHLGSLYIFSLRLDTRRIPKGVIKKYYNLAIKAEKERMDNIGQKFYLSRERRTELKEQVILKLKKGFLPVPGEFNVIWLPDKNEIWFASTQESMINLFMEHFYTSFGYHLEQLTPEILINNFIPDCYDTVLKDIESSQFSNSTPQSSSLESIDNILGQDFLTWLWYKSDTAPGNFLDKDGNSFSVSMENSIVVQAGQGEFLERTSASGNFSPLRDARLGLETGKKVIKAFIHIEQEGFNAHFTLKAENFSMSSVKTPKVNSDSDEDKDAMLLEKIANYEQFISLFDSIYETFLNKRFSESWDKEIDGIRVWMSKTD